MTRARRTVIVRIAFLLTGVLSAAAVPAQRLSQSTLLDAAVFHAFLWVDTSAYSPEVRTELEQYVKRSESYRPRPRPANETRGVMGLVYDARERYERRLVAASSRPGVEMLAQRYVDELRPCYEWEGFHDCPEREARFAEQHLAKNPNSPFAEFLPLLIAHRWLCAAEGYQYEERQQDAARARRAAAAPLATALKSRSLLIRTAAQEQQARGRCRAEAP